METGAIPTSVRFIAIPPATGGGNELVPPGGGVDDDETVPVGGGVETGAMPTSVRFIADAPRPGGCDPETAGAALTVLDEPPAALDVVAGGGVADPCGDMPTSVFFMAAAAGDVAGAAFIGPDDGFGRGGRMVAPHTPHVAVSGFAGDPQRGQTLMRADYFSQIQNAMP